MSPAMSSKSVGGWQDGYVVDVPYIEPITPDLCPAWLSMVCVLNGQPPLPIDRPLVWAELGSGSGVSACMVAAANENLEVWGCDFNPAHVERSRELARSSALSNCSFDEASFEQVANDPSIGPAEVDIVIVHGVYSWVSAANQRHIMEFIRRRLRPAGLAYVSYEVPTGWASMVPVSEAMRLHVDADGRRSDLAFPDALASIQRLEAGGAQCFPLGPNEQHQIDNLPDADVRYAVHEYLGSHFGPLMFDQVADSMAGARCSFVGSLDPVDHVPSFWVGPGLEDLVQATGDTVLREMIRDLAGQRALRRDLFRRGMAPSSFPQREAWWNDLTIVGLGKEFVEGATVQLPAGQAALEFDFYEPLVAELHKRPLSVANVREVGGASLIDAVTAVSILVADGYAAPAAECPDASATEEASRRLNRALVKENRLGRDHGCLIAPVTGSAITVEHIEMLVLGLLWDGYPEDRQTLATAVLEILSDQGRMMWEDGKSVSDPDLAQDAADRRVTALLARRARLAHLGVDGPEVVTTP